MDALKMNFVKKRKRIHLYKNVLPVCFESNNATQEFNMGWFLPKLMAERTGPAKGIMFQASLQ